ncbi:hypothetical protein ACWDFL_11855 [Streptomyces bungoensis]
MAERLPVAAAAFVALAGLRRAAARLPDPVAPGPTLTFALHALRHWLALFFLPALAVRYGVMFGTPELAAAAGVAVVVAAIVLARREAAPDAKRLGLAVLAAACAARAAAWAIPASYYEVTLLAAMAASLVTGVVVGGLADARARRSGAGAA